MIGDRLVRDRFYEYELQDREWEWDGQDDERYWELAKYALIQHYSSIWTLQQDELYVIDTEKPIYNRVGRSQG